MEKAAHQKTLSQLAHIERELEELRRETIDKDADLRLRLNELSTKNAERDRQVEDLVQ